MLAQQKYSEARQYLLKALRNAGTQLVNLTHEILVSFADLLIRTAEKEQSASILAFLVQQPTSSQDVNDRAESLRTEIDPDLYDSAVRQQNSDAQLATLLDQLLADLDTTE